MSGLWELLMDGLVVATIFGVVLLVALFF